MFGWFFGGRYALSILCYHLDLCTHCVYIANWHLHDVDIMDYEYDSCGTSVVNCAFYCHIGKEMT